jgi:hypothetical protein
MPIGKILKPTPLVPYGNMETALPPNAAEIIEHAFIVTTGVPAFMSADQLKITRLGITSPFGE